MLIGVVENNKDPLKEGRVQVRVFGKHTPDKNILPTEDLPWSIVGTPTDSASISGFGKTPYLLQGTWVRLEFLDKDEQVPFITHTIPTRQKKALAANLGFKDPDNEYPVYYDESDINRIARGVKESTITEFKESNAAKKIPTSVGSSWDEPTGHYNTEYPDNIVEAYHSGHVQEFDNTPNSERIHTFHKSGTFHEYLPNGDLLIKTHNSRYILISKDEKVFIRGNYDMTVWGDANIAVVGNVTQTVGGDMKTNVKGLYRVDAENIELVASNSIKDKSESKYTETNDKSVKSPITKFSDNVDVGKNVKIGTSLKVPTIDSTTINTGTTNSSTVISATVNAATVNAPVLNGLAGKAKDALYATFASKSGVAGSVNTVTPSSPSGSSIPSAPSVPSSNVQSPSSASSSGLNREEYKDLETPDYKIEETTFDYDDEEVNGSDRQDELWIGYNDDAPLSEETIEVPATHSGEPIVQDLECPFIDDSFINDNLSISRTLKIKSLTLDPYFPHKLRPQRGLTLGEIACNLKHLASNVVQPLVNEYGDDMIITSAFRVSKSPNSKSQHEIGQAIDIQFKSLSQKPEEYYARIQEIAKLVPFDQLILEYKNTGTRLPWIHISYNDKGNRRKTLTMFNHRVHSQGFTKLV